MVFVCIVIIISVAFVFTYPFLRIASDCDRQMEEMMKKAEKRKEEISESQNCLDADAFGLFYCADMTAILSIETNN